MTEDWKFERRRERLVEELREKGITDERVLAAIHRVPRHRFVDQALIQRAYNDEALPIGLKQTISQPYTVAFQSQTLAPKKGERILEIGTGSGYQASVLFEMGAQVFSVERMRGLYERTTPLLRSLGYKIVTRFGDGMQGWESMGPFDGIIVTAGALEIPEVLLHQLKKPEGMKSGGRMIIPVGPRKGQVMTYVVRTGEDSYESVELEECRFVPLLGNTEG
jgi:protein-L-isoaspartate(D-aspartate) O-methyltransferase